MIFQVAASGCYDFLAQFMSTHKQLYLSSALLTQIFKKVYRCWIVWGQNIRVAIIPSFLAIAYLGQSSYLYLISRFQFDASSYLARATRRINILQGQIVSVDWGTTVGITSLAASMAVNALVTGLIAFKILKVFLEVKPISVDLTGDSKLRHVMFVIIESGMVLFAIQLIRLVFYILPEEWTIDASDYAIAIHEMFNVIIITYDVPNRFLLIFFYW